MPRKRKKGGKNKVPQTPLRSELPLNEKVVALKKKAGAAYGSSHYDEALRLFSEAILEAPTDPTLYSNRSLTYLELRNYPAAVSDAKEAIRHDNTWPRGYFRLGQAQEGLLQYQLAARAYQQGLEVAPTDPTLLAATQQLNTLLTELKLTEQVLYTVGLIIE